MPQVAESAFNGAAKRIRLWLSSTFAHAATVNLRQEPLIFGKIRDEVLWMWRARNLPVLLLTLSIVLLSLLSEGPPG